MIKFFPSMLDAPDNPAVFNKIKLHATTGGNEIPVRNYFVARSPMQESLP